jgi:hypothetical protein
MATMNAFLLLTTWCMPKAIKEKLTVIIALQQYFGGRATV